MSSVRLRAAARPTGAAVVTPPPLARDSARRPTRRNPIPIVCVTAAVLCSALWCHATRPLVCGDNAVEGAAAAAATTTTTVGRFARDGTLRFVAALFRHGDRAPLFDYKTNPHTNAFPEGIGELTKKGKQHMYKKGQIFRNIYNGFLSDLYSGNEILIKTTNMSRTYMSAAMVLAGLYPPRDYQKWSDLETVWQPIPIYNDSPDDSGLLSDSEKCPYIHSFKMKISPQIFANIDKNKTASLLSYLSKNCGQPITVKNLHFLHDLLKCQISANLPQPEWLNPNYLQTIISIFDGIKFTKILYGNSKIQQFIVGRLLQEIGLEMESRSHQSEQDIPRKMHLYSGHDFSVGMALSSLNTYVENINFGASIHFHLHYYEKIGYIVKVFYFDRWDDENGRELTTIPICGDHCKLQDFIQHVRYTFSETRKEECQRVEN